MTVDLEASLFSVFLVACERTGPWVFQGGLWTEPGLAGLMSLSEQLCHVFGETASWPWWSLCYSFGSICASSWGPWLPAPAEVSARTAPNLTEFQCSQQRCCHFKSHPGSLQRFKWIPAQFMSPFLYIPLGQKGCKLGVTEWLLGSSGDSCYPYLVSVRHHVFGHTRCLSCATHTT